MKQIRIAGFTDDIHADDKPTVCVFGEENTGKTRMGCTMPADNGAIGWIPMDKNTRRTLEEYKAQYGLHVIAPEKPFVDTKASIALSSLDTQIDADKKKICGLYGDAYKRVLEAVVKLAEHPDIESVGVDYSQVWDLILMSHFGRKNQIESFQRGAPNQDLIDLLNALQHKNLCLMARATEVWADTGETDNQGRKKQAPTGKFKADGSNKVNGFMTCTLHLSAKRGKVKDLEDKYRVKVITTKGNTLLEGSDLHEFGVSGEAITWTNVMTVLEVPGA